MRVDALVAERLTASPRIYDVYGHCGLSILSELFLHGDLEEDAYFDEDDFDENIWEPQNNLTAVEKLEISLQMAEALADLHGYPGGVIVHQDIKMPQFLWNKDKTIVKLNDFNRAEFMLWNDQNHDYCRYNEFEHRHWRSPEEYFDTKNMNEQVDVFNMGTLYYVLLTGRWITWDDVNERTEYGGKLYIDERYQTRSPAEAKLVEIIDRCKEYYPEDRPSIFDIIQELRQTLNDIHGGIGGLETQLQ